MRTTLDIDPDILQLAKEVARRELRSAGAVISELARAGFKATTAAEGGGEKKTRNGVAMLCSRREMVTMEQVRRLIDEEAL